MLLIQVSSNISHGPLQGLIPDVVPEDQRGRASAIKSVMELLPIILVGITIAKLVDAGQLNWAIFATARRCSSSCSSRSSSSRKRR